MKNNNELSQIETIHIEKILSDLIISMVKVGRDIKEIRDALREFNTKNKKIDEK